jgi:hypothetical protein
MSIFSRIFKKKVDGIIAKEVDARRAEIQVGISALDSIYEVRKKEYEVKIADIDVLKSKVETELKELERIRIKSEDEQKLLWERLDILRDNLNTEDVWMKLWEMAYSKATDAVWLVLQKEMLHLADLAENRAYLKAKAEFDSNLSGFMEHLTKMSNDKEAIPFIKVLTLKKDIEDKKLVAERINNDAQKEQIIKLTAQLELIGVLL